MSTGLNVPRRSVQRASAVAVQGLSAGLALLLLAANSLAQEDESMENDGSLKAQEQGPAKRGYDGIAEQEAELMQGFVHPPVIFDPGDEYGPDARKYQGIPSIERAPGGRLWAVWYAGPLFEDKFNYVVVATSGDDGATWSDLKMVIDPDGDGPLRASDPCFWMDPNGKLWLFWWMNGNIDGGAVWTTMAISTENPDDESPDWCEPRALFAGTAINKPIVTSEGEWFMPTALWNLEKGTRVVASKDCGKTWTVRGAARIPENRRNCDEHMVVERKDGSFWMLIRVLGHGIAQSISTDGGRSWTDAEDHLLMTTSRFHISRLNSGNLLLIKHNGVNERKPGRNHLTAYLSDDDGGTWKGGLLLDERESVSYPDATQAPNGTIYAIYDWNRFDEKNILMKTFTEDDILAGAYVSDVARSRVLVNKATGINPNSLLRSDRTAAPLKMDTVATVAPEKGEIRPLRMGDTLFSNRDYVLQTLPWQFHGEQQFSFLFSEMEQSAATCVEPGMVYVLTPTIERNQDSAEKALLAQGFEKTTLKEFYLFLPPDNMPRTAEACSVFQKHVVAGEEVRFGKWGVLVLR